MLLFFMLEQFRFQMQVEKYMNIFLMILSVTYLFKSCLRLTKSLYDQYLVPHLKKSDIENKKCTQKGYLRLETLVFKDKT